MIIRASRPIRGVASLILLLLTAVLTGSPPAQAEVPQDGWLVKSPASDTVIVFVHGILSSSKACWASTKGSYWPSLLSSDLRFNHPNIYMGGYSTGFDSGTFKIRDAADELLNFLQAPDGDNSKPVLSRRNIVFIAHSMGGLVVKELLTDHFDLFKGKTVGVILVASPSRGSEWANRLAWLSEYYGNQMAIDLQRQNSYLDDLDRRFFDLVHNPHADTQLDGLDLFEAKFIIPRPWYAAFLSAERPLVDADNSTSYFHSYQIIPESDHFTIVKPDSTDDPVEVAVANWFVTRFIPLTQSSPAAAIWGIEPSKSGRKLFRAEVTVNSGSISKEEFNRIWTDGISYRVNSLITTTLHAPPVEFQFEGTAVVPSVEAGDFERLSEAGHALNGVAVAATVVQPPAGGDTNFLAQTTFRAMFNPPDGQAFVFPVIEEQVPGGNLGPISVERALSKSWGYYVVLALASRCLADQPEAHCDQAHLKKILSDALVSLGPNDKELAVEFSRMISLAGN